MLAFLAQVPQGRFQFEIGIQSTNSETLAAIDRRIDPQLAHDPIRRLATAANIHLHVDLILGLPHETRATFLRSFAAVFAMGAHYIQMGLLKILPDTPIERSAEAMG
jgi:coproporphyrinogen III oxidase-like Fe-S oxidoreductase